MWRASVREVARRKLRPGQASPGGRPLAPEPLDLGVRLPPVRGLLLHARAVARRELGHGVAHLPLLRRRGGPSSPAIRITHGPSPAPTKACSAQGGEWKKSQGRRRRSSPSTSSLHSPRQDEERLLGRLGVVEAVLAGSRTVTLIPSCANSTGGSPYSLSKLHAAPLLSENHHSASRTFTTNQPSVTGARSEPESLELRLGHRASLLVPRAYSQCPASALISRQIGPQTWQGFEPVASARCSSFIFASCSRSAGFAGSNACSPGPSHATSGVTPGPLTARR